MRLMFKLIRIYLIAMALWTGYSSMSFAQGSAEDSSSFLFKINRSRDADEIWYTINLNRSGNPDNDQPIKAYWVRKTKNNVTEPLTWVQNKYAYGISIVQPYDMQSRNLKFQFVSYAQQTFELRKSEDGDFNVFTSIDNKEIEVARIFVQIDGGSFWVPSVPFVKLMGYDVTSYDLVAQTIKP